MASLGSKELKPPYKSHKLMGVLWALTGAIDLGFLLLLAVFFIGPKELINPLPTNDAPMRHDLSELSISLWEFIWGV